MALSDFFTLEPAGKKVLRDTAGRVLPEWALGLFPEDRAKAVEKVNKETVIERTTQVMDKRMIWVVAGGFAALAGLIFLSKRRR